MLSWNDEAFLEGGDDNQETKVQFEEDSDLDEGERQGGQIKHEGTTAVPHLICPILEQGEKINPDDHRV
jgi:hypothetical protein